LPHSYILSKYKLSIKNSLQNIIEWYGRIVNLTYHKIAPNTYKRYNGLITITWLERKSDTLVFVVLVLSAWVSVLTMAIETSSNALAKTTKN